MTRRIVFTTPTLTHYRARFHELVRENLARHKLEYVLIYGQPNPTDSEKGDVVDIVWASKIRNRYGVAPFHRVLLQPFFHLIRRGDFVILDHENWLLANYPLLALRRLLGIKVALWGHGRNFQSRHPYGLKERWKRYWTNRPDWWFTCTEETAVGLSP